MKFVSLVSSGIDSPVATYMLTKREADVVLVHADNRPFTNDREIEKFLLLAKYLKQHISGTVKAYRVPHGNTLSVIKEKCTPKYTCVLCKRMLVRYAETIAEQEQGDAIVMGDSLGQVASQTLYNIRVVEQAVHVPVLRPLIGFDKEEITRIAKTIGTYNLSIQPSQGCSAVPDKPSTRARLDEVLAEEEKIHVDELVAAAMRGLEAVFS
jgi:thiamine biosynthesis protein ThiI